MNKAKKVSVRRIIEDSDEGRELYAQLRGLIMLHHTRRNLNYAKFALVWQADVEPDQDDIIMLGKCRKASDFDKEFSAYDFVIVLNKDAWQRLDARQRDALMDHELAHAAPVLNSDGSQKEDERGRRVWRVRKHDIEEFREIVERHGCWKRELEDFIRAGYVGQPNLFDGVKANAEDKPPAQQPPAVDTVTFTSEDLNKLRSALGNPAEEPAAQTPEPAAPIDPKILEKALFHSLTQKDGSGAKWHKLRKTGATDHEIGEAVADVFGSISGAVIEGVTYWAKAAPSPRFWFAVPIEQEPTLAGQPLIDEVRRIISIPTKPQPAAKPDDDWRSVKLDTLGLATSIVEKLAAAGLTTIGQLSNHLQPNAPGYANQLTDIKGIGEAKATAIEDALAAFWARRNKGAAA